jgi:SAM-dependent methyltransferase
MGRTDHSYVARIRRKYNEIREIWDRTDRWHVRVRQEIENEVRNVAKEFALVRTSESVVLDVGSAGYSYFETKCLRIDLDIAERSLSAVARGVCANAEMLPFRPRTMDLVLCVGPVVNYCSLEEVVAELASVTRPCGTLVLHVELSNSLEYWGTRAFGADVSFVRSFYKGAEDYWVYSDGYVRRVLSTYGFSIARVRYFHFLSSLAYRLTGQANLCAPLAGADVFLRWVPFCRSVADSAIYVGRREVLQ